MYREYGNEKLTSVLAELQGEYAKVKAQGLALNMARGVPGPDQIELGAPILDALRSTDSLKAEDGSSCGTYGCFDGIPEAKRLMAEILDVQPEDIFMGGSSSLNLMHDLTTFCMLYPLPGSDKGWRDQGKVKFLCPSPGYDRHFGVSQHLGLELVMVPMTSIGPDMDMVETLVKDPAVKGMWSIPKYSNPTGITYSDETVRRIANLSPAAKDFRIFWDNAYAVHDLHPDAPDRLLPLMAELRKVGNEDLVFMFSSTSKVSFPGGGISAVAASKNNLDFIKKHMFFQTISFDKLNQLRHARYFKNLSGIQAHMRKHAEKLLPKFSLVLDMLETELGGLGIASWEKPRGGYFIALDTMEGCAKRVVELCKEAGVALTPAGATHPYGNDPNDKTIRIAPTFPGLDELSQAISLLCLCVKIAAAEKLVK